MLWEGLEAYQIALVLLLTQGCSTLAELMPRLVRISRLPEIDCLDVPQGWYDKGLVIELDSLYLLSMRGQREAIQLLTHDRLCAAILCDEVLHA